ncbi:hypothetical protein EVAR_101945_1 [Eumeta japonica]|uniref:Uncharacterized protein n=1 Tax=Eumeta variegata TaxID=151549 RepID=A0A4C1TSD7_EUMVA|nr:hypothetical protein EVAR_101945_1 [Eumeta japonica]
MRPIILVLRARSDLMVTNYRIRSSVVFCITRGVLLPPDGQRSRRKNVSARTEQRPVTDTRSNIVGNVSAPRSQHQVTGSGPCHHIGDDGRWRPLTLQAWTAENPSPSDAKEEYYGKACLSTAKLKPNTANMNLQLELRLFISKGELWR